MKKKTFIQYLIVSSLMLSILQLNAQDSINKIQENYQFGVGGGAGFTTGYGLSFRYVPKRFGAQINFAPYKDKNETERYSLGVTLIYMLMQNKITNFYLYQGNHYYYNSEIITIYNPNIPDHEEKIRNTDRYFNNGFGFGIEIIMARRIGLNLMAGYAFYNNFQQLNVTGEMALYYKF